MPFLNPFWYWISEQFHDLNIWVLLLGTPLLPVVGAILIFGIGYPAKWAYEWWDDRDLRATSRR